LVQTLWRQAALEQFSKEPRHQSIDTMGMYSNEVFRASDELVVLATMSSCHLTRFLSVKLRRVCFKQSIKPAEQLWAIWTKLWLKSIIEKKTWMLATYTIFLTLGGTMVSATTPKSIDGTMRYTDIRLLDVLFDPRVRG